jgi:putative membrane protein
MTTEQFVISAWNWNPVALLASAAALIAYLYVFGIHRRIAYLIVGIGVFLLTLTSPINALADGYLFSAHMLQHILLLLIVPAFLLMSLPRSVPLEVRPRFLAHPLVGWCGGVGAMWVWHARTLCDAAVSSRPVYVLQTVSLLVLGAFFWRQVIAPREEERLSPPAAVLYLFGACTACSILGILITFSPVSVCPIYTKPLVDRFNILHTIRNGWGFTPEKDQQVGGLLMWVPMCLVYLGAIFAQIARWFAEPAPAESSIEKAL